jgi:mannose/fructose-specific phosphotransferase system component IIA
MNDRVPVRGVVLTHGSMAEGLVDAVQQIAGAEPDALIPISNRGLSPQTVIERIRALAGRGPLVLFTDLQSGSCAFAVRQLCRERSDMAAIAGVNLPLLLDFVLHRDQPLAELVPRLLNKGRSAICCIPPELEDHAHRPV